MVDFLGVDKPIRTMNPKFRPVESNKPITKVPVLMTVGRCP